MAVYNVVESLTPPVPLTAMHTGFMSHLLVLAFVLVLLQLVLTTTLAFLGLCDDYEPASQGEYSHPCGRRKDQARPRLFCPYPSSIRGSAASWTTIRHLDLPTDNTKL